MRAYAFFDKVHVEKGKAGIPNNILLRTLVTIARNSHTYVWKNRSHSRQYDTRKSTAANISV